MPGKLYRCKVIDLKWLGGNTVMWLKFTANSKIRYEPGQFVSLVVPAKNGRKRARRPYTFAISAEIAWRDGYEVAVKYVEGGAGSEFLRALQPGDQFQVTAPYGDFCFDLKSERRLCLIATGTGITPFRALIHSKEFKAHQPEHVLCLYGVRSEDEIIFRGEFERAGVEMIYAVSRASENASENGVFRGRVTDYLKSLPMDWHWQATDFYLCGNGKMITEARKILIHGRAVGEKAIIQESFSEPKTALPQESTADRKDDKAA